MLLAIKATNLLYIRNYEFFSTLHVLYIYVCMKEVVI